MRRFITLMLAFFVLLSMGFSAATAQATEIGSADVKAGYVAGPESNQVISVDISWGHMEFTYNGNENDVWDPKNHQYLESEAGWEESKAYIALKNHSNVALQAEITYTPTSNAHDDMSLSFTSTKPYIGSAETKPKGEGQGEPCQIIVRAIPRGFLDKGATTGTAGTIKVRVTPEENLQKIVYSFEGADEFHAVMKDTYPRGTICYQKSENQTAVADCFSAAMTALNNTDTWEKNVAVNALLTTYYNNLYLAQKLQDTKTAE